MVGYDDRMTGPTAVAGLSSPGAGTATRGLDGAGNEMPRGVLPTDSERRIWKLLDAESPKIEAGDPVVTTHRRGAQT